ncbi:MAG TPA: hypothetical protein VHI98_11195 [Vicinamibacterales bacterium]|jgi:hypothetical protein|nr:hypothetical protein [Vicinamibacterales bacterium]
MSDFQIRSDGVDVEQIMRQIRSRIREKRGADYTEQEIRELATAKLEKFLDPSGVRSDLLQHFRRAHAAQQTADPPMNYVFEDTTLFESPRPALRFIRNLLKPVLRLFFNYNRLSHVLHQQVIANTQMHGYEARRKTLDALYYEVMHNLVLETTRLGIEVTNLRMRLESISSRLDFDERRARALEGVVQYRPSVIAAAASQPSPSPQSVSQGQPGQGQQSGPSMDPGVAERRSRRRRRRGKRRGHGVPPGAQGAQAQGVSGAGAGQSAGADAHDEQNEHPHREHQEHSEHLEHPDHGESPENDEQ